MERYLVDQQAMSEQGDGSEKINTGRDLLREAGERAMATPAGASAASCLPDVDWPGVMGKHLRLAVARTPLVVSADSPIPDNFLDLAEGVKAHPLHGAATCCDISPAALSKLLSKPETGFNCDVLDSNDMSPLHWVCSGGRADWAGGLLLAGASKDLVDNRGRSALMMAALGGYVETVRLLCAAGADTELEDNATGGAALHVAVVDGNLELARVLVHEGRANLNHRTTTQRQSPLHLAASDGRADFVRMLCAAGADTEIREGRTGYMPLHSAVSEGHMAVTVALMECGANPNSRSLMRESFFGRVFSYSTVTVVCYLLRGLVRRLQRKITHTFLS